MIQKSAIFFKFFPNNVAARYIPSMLGHGWITRGHAHKIITQALPNDSFLED